MRKFGPQGADGNESSEQSLENISQLQMHFQPLRANYCTWPFKCGSLFILQTRLALMIISVPLT